MESYDMVKQNTEDTLNVHKVRPRYEIGVCTQSDSG